LRHSIAQQYDVLIKGLNLTLQLDAINQINGNWHMLTAQGIQKWILQKLTFVVVHDILRVQKLVRS
jgi:hypothetical protein